jgi:hypothetical protein
MPRSVSEASRFFGLPTADIMRLVEVSLGLLVLLAMAAAVLLLLSYGAPLRPTVRGVAMSRTRIVVRLSTVAHIISAELGPTFPGGRPLPVST